MSDVQKGTDDIPLRLKLRAVSEWNGIGGRSLAAEAADRIERLETALADVLEPQTDWDLEQAMGRARKVLDNAE
jgi:hypothetical protein